MHMGLRCRLHRRVSDLRKPWRTRASMGRGSVTDSRSAVSDSNSPGAVLRRGEWVHVVALPVFCLRSRKAGAVVLVTIMRPRAHGRRGLDPLPGR
jgi:hypothetical protein